MKKIWLGVCWLVGASLPAWAPYVRTTPRSPSEALWGNLLTFGALALVVWYAVRRNSNN